MESAYYFLKKKSVYYKILLKDILYFKADGDYLRIQLDNDKQYFSQANIGDLETQLAPEGFFRIHRSYLIKVSRIEAVDFIKSEIQIGNQWLPFSRTKRNELKDFVNARMLEF